MMPMGVEDGSTHSPQQNKSLPSPTSNKKKNPRVQQLSAGTKSSHDWDGSDSLHTTRRMISSTMFIESLSAGSSSETFSKSSRGAGRHPQESGLFPGTRPKVSPLDLSSLGLYGRDDSIRELRQRFEASKISRQLVLISGEAGTGKSSLAQDLQQFVLTNQDVVDRRSSDTLASSEREVNETLPPPALLRQQDDEEEEDKDKDEEKENRRQDDDEEAEPSSALKNLNAVGKFDQQQRDEPYAGIAAACNELCQVVLEHRYNPKYAPAFHKMQAKLVEAVGNYSDVLTSVVPKLRHILDQQHEEDEEKAFTSMAAGKFQSKNKFSFREAAYLESKYRFTRAFLAFIRIVASSAKSLVLTLDDLQWADQSSLDLMQAMLTDLDNPAIMLIGIYRSEGITESHSLSKFIRDIQSLSAHGAKQGGADLSDSWSIPEPTGFSSTMIAVGNLDVAHVCEMFGDLLKMDRHEVESLALCVHKKTMGNAFFVKQFIGLLHKAGLLHVNGIEPDRWTWDVEAIRAETSATENVADLMTTKLKGMSLGVKSVIPLVASLGAIFSRSFLQLVFDRFGILMDVDEDREETFGPDDFLQECEQEGLICSLEHGLYSWEHDKIQEAALSLVEPSRRSPLQFQLGEVLLSRLDSSELDHHIFVVANLLGDSIWLGTEDPRRTQAAEVLLKAGKKAAKISAFELAAHYLQRGIELLPPDVWEHHPTTGLDLYSCAAEAEVCLGHFEKMQEYCDHILALRLPLLDKRRVYTALIRSYRSQAKNDITRLLCMKVLAELGLRIPRRGLGFRLETLLSMLKLKLSSKWLLNRLANAPTIEHEALKWREELVVDLALTCFQESPEMTPAVIMKGLQSMAKNGISEYSAATVVSAAYMLVILREYKASRLYAEQALSLLKSQSGSNNLVPRCLFILNFLILSWQIPLEECLKGLLQGYQTGISLGDTEHGGWSIYCYFECAFHCGKNIETISKECRIYFRQMTELKQKKISTFIWMAWATVRALGGDAADLNQQQSVYADYLEEKHFRANQIRWNLAESFWLANYSRFLVITKESRFDQGAYEKDYRGVPGVPAMHFHFALVGYICTRDPKLRKAQSSLPKLSSLRRKFHRKIKMYARKGNPNVVHYELLLDAEAAALKRDHTKAAECFSKAIVEARERGFRNEEALAHECFAEYEIGMARSGDGTKDHSVKARTNMEKAIWLYGENGMHARAKKLTSRYNELYVSQDPPLLDICVG